MAAFDLPVSGFLSSETREVLKQEANEREELAKECPSGNGSADDVVALRTCVERYEYRTVIARDRARYNVTVDQRRIGGVTAQIVTARQGSVERRILLNLHGGGFVSGGHWQGEVESIPIAAVSKIRVVSVDYRAAPEYHFPAATEDVAAVYKELVKEYGADNIGIYGCSAGALLTAEVVAWLENERLPLPAAIGLFGNGAFISLDNDSIRLYQAMSGQRVVPIGRAPGSYFSEADVRNPLAAPGIDPARLAKFPDTLLINSIRDGTLSNAVATQAELVRLGVRAELHVWEGLGHCFISDSRLPESRDAYQVIADFFTKHLGH